MNAEMDSLKKLNILFKHPKHLFLACNYTRKVQQIHLTKITTGSIQHHFPIISGPFFFLTILF